MKKLIPPVILLSLITLITLPGFLIKANVKCINKGANCPSEILNEITPINGKKMFFARRDIKKLLNNNFLVVEFSIQYKLPNILEIETLLKEPIFGILKKDSNEYILIDKEGNVLSKSSGTQLPYIIINEQLPDAKTNIGQEKLNALKLIDGVGKMYQTRTGVIEGGTLLVDLPGPVRVIFPLTDIDREYLLGSLRLIYSNITNSEGRKYSQIDMRYANPVLR